MAGQATQAPERPQTGTPGGPRPRGRPRKSERDDMPVKMERALVCKAKLIAAHRGISAAEVVSDLLRAGLDRAYYEMLRELEARGG